MSLRMNFAVGESNRSQPETSGSPHVSGRGNDVIAHTDRGQVTLLLVTRGRQRPEQGVQKDLSCPGWWQGWGTDLEEIALVNLVK